MGNDTFGVKGNNSEVSKGGEMFRSLIKSERYFVLNNSEKAIGGPWTWFSRQKEEWRSCLDIGIASIELEQYVYKVIIDKDKKFTPRRVQKKKTTFTDHLSIMIMLKDIPKGELKEVNRSFWNTNKPGPWEAYKDLSDKLADKINVLIDTNENDINVVVKKIEKMEDKVKFQSFGKTKLKNKKVEKTVRSLNDVELLEK